MIKQIIQWIWCLPQNIIGLFVLIFTKFQKSKTDQYNGTFVIRWKYSNGVSLGQFIFVSENADENTIKHEYGHHIDGNCLGPLYLFVIGIPSICWAAFGRKYRIKHNKSYYDFFTERRADRLGEVKRK